MNNEFGPNYPFDENWFRGRQDGPERPTQTPPQRPSQNPPERPPERFPQRPERPNFTIIPWWRRRRNEEVPIVFNIESATLQNNYFRRVIWTGDHLQLTLMSINVGEDIGLEIHPEIDQFLRIEQGQGTIMMGEQRNNLDYQQRVSDGFAIIIPAGTWHNLINTGRVPLKLYSIYAPPQHRPGTVHVTKADAEEKH